MLHQLNRNGVVLMLCLLSSRTGLAIDGSTEAEISNALGKRFATETVINLPSTEHPSLALYNEAKIPEAHGGILLVHDIGGHADWPSVISPLRNKLAESGWHTLSLQMPSPTTPITSGEMNNLIEIGSKRIQAGIQFFKDKGVYNVVLIGYRLGADIALSFLTKQAKGSNEVSACVVIGMYDHPTLPPHSSADLIAGIDIPVLDVVGERYSDHSLNAAQQRETTARKTANKAYQQLWLAGADEQFDGLQETLIRRVTGWLRSRAPGIAVDKPKLPVDNAR